MRQCLDWCFSQMVVDGPWRGYHNNTRGDGRKKPGETLTSDWIEMDDLVQAHLS